MDRRAAEQTDLSLSSRIIELEGNRFLIFRPRDYHHSPHVHPHRYRFRVIKGRIEVRLGGRKMIARAEQKVTLEPGLSCETRALEDSWLLVERTSSGDGVNGASARRRRGPLA
jgi:hypothetical protein